MQEPGSHGLTRKEQKEETRSKLLNVSLLLFIRRGYGQTSLRDIASGAGVSTGLFFHYFATKEAVLVEHAKTASAGVSSVLNILQEDRPPRELFTEISSLVLDGLKNDYARYLYLLVNQINTSESIPSSAKHCVMPGEPVAVSVPVIERGQLMGEFREGDARSMATVYWGAIQGIAESITWNSSLTVPSPEILMRILEV